MSYRLVSLHLISYSLVRLTSFCYISSFRLRLGFTDCFWLRLQESGSKRIPDKPCVYTVPGISAVDRLSYPMPNGFTGESDAV